MCGIAGRVLAEPGLVGRDLVAMMAAQRHRGYDSTGFALYGIPRTDTYAVRALVDDRNHLDSALSGILAATREHGGDFSADPTWDSTGQPHVMIRVEVSDPSPLPTWIDVCDTLPGVELQSVGRALEIVKDTGDAREVAAKHGVESFVGTHGLGHARLATESVVSPVAGHPFWARPFPDVAIVHNGQLTNYYTWRRRLQQSGYRFTTENDSELIAVWNSVQMAAGATLEESLRKSQSDFDGVFTYLLSTIDAVGMAKDRWAIKPLATVEADDGDAMSTEEQALRSIYRDECEVITYDGPSAVRVWRADVRRRTEAAA